MRDLHFLRTPIRGDHQDYLQNLEINEVALNGNPLANDAYPQTLEISFDLDSTVTEIQIAPLWEGFFRFIPDSTLGSPTDPSEVIESNYTNWSVTGDLILRSYVNFTEDLSMEEAFELAIPFITPIPSIVRYSKVKITTEFLFSTLMNMPRISSFFNEEMVTPSDALYHEKLIINFLKGKAEVPCVVDPNDYLQDTAHQSMPSIELSPSGTRTVLKVTLASLSEKIGDLAWFNHNPEFDDISGEILVDNTLQNQDDLLYNPSHPSHSVISVRALFQSAKLVAYAFDHDVSRALRVALAAPMEDGSTYRRIELIRPTIPGSPVSSNPQRHYPMYQLCWKQASTGQVETLRIPLSGRFYLPLIDDQYTFWAIPRSQDPTTILIGEQLKMGLPPLAPSKYLGLPQETVDIDITNLEEVSIYSHLQEFDSLFVWEGFRSVVAEGTRTRLMAKAKTDWNTDVFKWHIIPTNNDSKKSFLPLYGYIRESAGRHGLAPEFLLTILMGEGANLAIEDRSTFDPHEDLDGFNFLGLDLILYRTGTPMPDGTDPPIPPEIPASNTDELAEYSYNLVTEGYVDPVTASAVSWNFETPNELGRTLQTAKIAGWATAIELVAAELHARLDEMVTYLAANIPIIPIVEENQRRFLSYVRFNSSPQHAKEHADDIINELDKWSGASSGDNRDALFNTIQRIAVSQWQEDSKVYR